MVVRRERTKTQTIFVFSITQNKKVVSMNVVRRYPPLVMRSPYRNKEDKTRTTFFHNIP